MSKYLFSAAAAAVMTLGASGAWADECDTSLLPNEKNWTYQQDQDIGDLAFNNGNQGFVTVTTRCNAVNKGGNVVDDHSYDIDGEGTQIHVCNNNKAEGERLTNEGAALGLTEAFCS